MSSFCDNFDLTSLIKEPTRYKNADIPSRIDLILTSKLLIFQNTCAAETGLSDNLLSEISNSCLEFDNNSFDKFFKM